MEKVNQHTVPAFYLRQFAPETGQRVLWQYSKAVRQSPQTKSPAKAAVEIHFYSTQREDGTWDHSIEDQFAGLESDVAPAFRRLLQDGFLVTADRRLVANFIGLMYLRNKALRDHALAQANKVMQPSAAIDYIERDREFLASRFGEKAVRAYTEKIKLTGTGIVMPKNFHLVSVFERAEKWGQFIDQMSWTILKAEPPNFFLTSDNPALTRKATDIFTPHIVGIKRRDLRAELGFPLSSYRFLLAKPARSQARRSGGRQRGDCVTMQCDRARVREMNLRVVLSGHEYIFGREHIDGIQDLVDKYRDFNVQHPEI